MLTCSFIEIRLLPRGNSVRPPLLSIILNAKFTTRNKCIYIDVKWL